VLQWGINNAHANLFTRAADRDVLPDGNTQV